MESTGEADTRRMRSVIKCAACDLIIYTGKKFWNVGETGHGIESDDLKGKGEIEKYIPKPEVWSTFCKYLLEGRSTRVKMFLANHQDDLTFCAFCMRQIVRIHAFEKEISQLYERIDGMINCMRMKIKASLEDFNYKKEEDGGKAAVREFMLGIEPSKAEGRRPRPRPTKSKAKEDEKVKEDSHGEVLEGEVGTKSQALNIGDDKEEEVQKEGRKSRIKKADFKEDKSRADEERNQDEGAEMDSDGGNDEDFKYEISDEDDEYDSRGETVSDRSSRKNTKEPEDSTEGSERKPRVREKAASGEAEAPARGKRNRRDRKDTRERKTGRRRLVITQLENNLFEWKGFKFQKQEDGKHICELCPTTILKSQPNLILHIRKLHLREGVGVFPCPVCNKSYERAEILKAHMFIHEEKQFQCYLCGKCYSQRGNLTHHIKTHIGQLKYHCEFENCGKAFLTRNQLTRHTSRHLGVKSFQCEYCSRLFVDRSELNRHILSHSEQMPFNCHLCKSSFFIKHRLNRHYRNVHRMDPPEVILTVGPKLPPKPTLAEPLPQESTEDPLSDSTGFVEETVPASESPGHPPSPDNPENLHKELITFESMLE